mgnify:CR=1 FL=1
MPRRRTLPRPRQARSRAREEALLRAATKLMAKRPFEAISVTEIAAAAGTSVGGFYARFGTKEGVLHHLDARIIEDALAGFDDALSDDRMADATVADVVRAYAGIMIRKFRQHRESLTTIIRVARGGDPEWAARARAFNTKVHGRLRALLTARRNEIAHPDPDLAIELGLAFASAVARETVLGNSLRAYPVAVSDDRLIAELTRMWTGYLTGRMPSKETR